MIATYYKAIENFDQHMIAIRNSEIRRIIFEGTEEEKAQCNDLFSNSAGNGKPKSKLH